MPKRQVDVAIAVLLIIPIVALLAIPVYNRTYPLVFGISFFYFYQLAWAPIAALMFYVAALLWNKRNREISSRKRARR
jgi:uncharacterized membrane protein